MDSFFRVPSIIVLIMIEVINGQLNVEKKTIHYLVELRVILEFVMKVSA